MLKPLFIKDRTSLLEGLRLSGTSGESSLQQIDDSMIEVRSGFYEALGAARVDAIVTMARSDTPATADQLTKAVAESIERKWIRLLLMRVMPSFFMPASNTAAEAWNDAGALREIKSDHNAEISRLQSEIDDGLQTLRGSSPETNVAVIGPTETNTYPGSRIYP